MRIFMLLVLLTADFLFAQYSISSPYLADPDKAIGYVDSCARFWQQSWDSVKGGFYTNVSRSGTLYSSWGTQKNMMTQSRHAYGQARAFMLTGNEWYLKRAADALNFMYQHAWDSANDGWYWELDANGSPTSNNTNKTAFYQHYALLGIAALFEATADSIHWRQLMKGYQSNEQHFWDSRPLQFGYFDETAVNWSYKKNKSFNATVDAITTHILSLYLLTGQEKYRTRLTQLVDNMLNRLYASMSGQKIGFVEQYDSDWNWDNSQTNTIMGHVLKTAWCLGRVNQLFPDTILVNSAEDLINSVWMKGYDHRYGGPYKDYNRTTGQMLMWGNPDTAKAWWQMEQAITAGLMLYDITKKPVYLQMADETVSFFMNYFVDRTYGEVYENRKNSGPLTWGDQKGNGNKASYHSIETGYYIYLYGNLMLQKRPASLYYYFAPASQERHIALNPLEINSARYRVKSVLLNGLEYTNFVSAFRILNIPANTGGKFKVTFEPSSGTAVADVRSLIPVELSLEQNYPNPFNSGTVIRYSVPANYAGKYLTVKLYDITGREAAILATEPEAAAGKKEVHVSLAVMQSLSSGIYIYTLSAGEMRISRKFVYLK